MSIKLFVMDVDGTLTDGTIYVGDSGEVVKAFNVKDGYAIAHILPKFGIKPVIITGRSSKIVSTRAAELGICELYQEVSDKLSTLVSLAKKYNAAPDEIAYIGDDLNDLPCIDYCVKSACPADAAPEVMSKVAYVCSKKGGKGAVREFVDLIVKNKEYL